MVLLVLLCWGDDWLVIDPVLVVIGQGEGCGALNPWVVVRVLLVAPGVSSGCGGMWVVGDGPMAFDPPVDCCGGLGVTPV